MKLLIRISNRSLIGSINYACQVIFYYSTETLFEACPRPRISPNRLMKRHLKLILGPICPLLEVLARVKKWAKHSQVKRCHLPGLRGHCELALGAHRGHTSVHEAQGRGSPGCALTASSAPRKEQHDREAMRKEPTFLCALNCVDDPSGSRPSGCHRPLTWNVSILG